MSTLSIKIGAVLDGSFNTVIKGSIVLPKVNDKGIISYLSYNGV